MSSTSISKAATSLRAWVTGDKHQYSALPESGSDLPFHEGNPPTAPSRGLSKKHVNRRCLRITGVALCFIVLVHVGVIFRAAFGGSSARDEPDIRQYWGQYSPFFPVKSDIDPSVPAHCEVDFVQVLSRHGSRDPTAGKSDIYRDLIDRIHRSVDSYGKGYEFLENYEYTLGKDQLSAYGEQEMVDSGKAFYGRYQNIAHDGIPFIRVSGQNRVIVSGKNWTQGFYHAKVVDGEDGPRDGYLEDMLVIPEEEGVNNTLSHGQCPAFEGDGDEGGAGHDYSNVGDEAKLAWQDVFMPPIAERVNRRLPGAELGENEVIYLMDLCPFETVANPDLELSPFCALFSPNEWKGYDYYQTLSKYYGFNAGNPMGPTQGVGWVNELIARLTGQPVQDETTTNSTLDGDEETFPLRRSIYADFSHDNDMLTVYGALGLYNNTEPLPKTERVSAENAEGFSAAWTVPFGARMYVEKMRCGFDKAEPDGEELVRILVNERVVPLVGCDADELGRCKLSDFVEGLEFARSGGQWDQCFA